MGPNRVANDVEGRVPSRLMAPGMPVTQLERLANNDGRFPARLPRQKREQRAQNFIGFPEALAGYLDDAVWEPRLT